MGSGRDTEDTLCNETHPLRGLLAGVAGGLVASYVMNVFLAGSSKAQETLKAPEEKAQEQTQESGEDSTQKVADAVTYVATGEHLSREQKQTGGPIVHYVFGGAMGGLYGLVAEYAPGARIGLGSAFGSVLFLGADELIVPALGLGKSPVEQPVSSQANYLAAHMVYGATVELVRRAFRRMI